MAILRTAPDLARAIRRDIGKLRTSWVSGLRTTGMRAVQRSTQTRTYGDVTYRAINSHFSEVVAFGGSRTVQFKRADDSTFDVVLDSKPDSVVLYIGNFMQYMLWVERIYGRDCIVQELPRIRKDLPQDLLGAWRMR